MPPSGNRLGAATGNTWVPVGAHVAYQVTFFLLADAPGASPVTFAQTTTLAFAGIAVVALGGAVMVARRRT